jgi:hypothetical protein
MRCQTVETLKLENLLNDALVHKVHSPNHWHKSYEPTKLELLGVATSIIDCSSYLRSHHFVVECDHAVLRPLIQKQLKGVIDDPQLQVALAWLVHTIYANGSELSNQNAQLECFLTFLRFPDVSDKEHILSAITASSRTIQLV